MVSFVEKISKNVEQLLGRSSSNKSSNELTSQEAIESFINSLREKASDHRHYANTAIEFGDTSDQAYQRVYAGMFDGVATKASEHIADIGNKVVKKLSLEDTHSYFKEATVSSLNIFPNGRDEVKRGYEGMKEQLTGLFIEALNEQLTKVNQK
jgi:hypothetical protein